MQYLNTEMIFLIGVATAILVVISLFTALILRRVVPTNEVQVVQSRGQTTSYGKDTGNGNVYYEWPAWLPVIGVLKNTLPVSVFNLNLNAYDAYDMGRVPFVVDVVAFFRVADYNLAASRVANFAELQAQLTNIVKGAIRTAIYPGQGSLIGKLYCALKLNGEAGEVADKVGKVLRDNQADFSDEKKLEIAIELGDNLWYIAALAKELGFTMLQIAGMNIEKLNQRKQAGTLGGSGDKR